MTTTPSVLTYAVRVEYFTGDDVFAAETLLVDQPASGEIEAAATIAAEASPYFNASVPELSYAMTIAPFDPDDPEPPPAGARAAGLYPLRFGPTRARRLRAVGYGCAGLDDVGTL
ncbi:hypothetical protein ATE68_00120 [Sphingopyxis sp. H038]|uniref:hypothetical protein n=1 Tax=unclassified Sphingopyxis TaxID=2614943 RepID=UPI00073741E6|nr:MULTISPECIES: hypothetical protein [unclassified Sphingopyxis]KTE04113.1 hypothetical protein ATE78_00120 [Sphingopyxis sp. H012]KTE15628.1 hypothetical protein ATE76_02300 [Sphingopyxis sp. H093]KTE15900.1 hypothetical protein ATE76_03920 [Sphingopyxis sp. H093]KTE21711.1 hypothetical protein ATE67_03355 [Sphingopyxis sp. H050]KTE22359.1 hypothetical protein ATE75_20450 [Sphingopyxis sp. H080]